MKALSLLLFISLTGFLQAADADSGLKNGDFSDGLNHWEGDGEDVGQAAPELASKGLMVKLSPSEWKKVYQDFRPSGGDFDCTVTYKLSGDCQFSTQAQDYKNVPSHTGMDLWKSFDIPMGDWMILVSDYGNSVTGTFFPIKSDIGANGTGTFQTKLVGLSTAETIAFDFPPGHGSVVILNVSVTPGKASVITDTPDFTVTGAGATIQKLTSGAKAYSNKRFIWENIPDSLAGYSYTQIDDTKDPSARIAVHAKNDCVIQVATIDSAWDWPRTPNTSFSLTDRDHAVFSVYHHQLHAGEDYVLPQPPVWYGVILLIPGASGSSGNP